MRSGRSPTTATLIGRIPRSCPAAYIGFWDRIRQLSAATTEARMLGWAARRFSFNTKGGRCDVCDGCFMW